jgi:hypothetical protein
MASDMKLEDMDVLGVEIRKLVVSSIGMVSYREIQESMLVGNWACRQYLWCIEEFFLNKTYIGDEVHQIVTCEYQCGMYITECGGKYGEPISCWGCYDSLL